MKKIKRRASPAPVQPSARTIEVREVAPTIRAADVIRRMKQAVRARTDAELAHRLGVSKPTIASWRLRGSIPFEQCIRLALEEMQSLDWLIFGKETQPNPDIIGGPLDLDILATVFFHGAYDQWVPKLEDRWAESRFRAKALAREYLRHLALLQQAVSSGKLSRSEFIEMLRYARAETTATRG